MEKTTTFSLNLCVNWGQSDGQAATELKKFASLLREIFDIISTWGSGKTPSKNIELRKKKIGVVTLRPI